MPRLPPLQVRSQCAHQKGQELKRRLHDETEKLTKYQQNLEDQELVVASITEQPDAADSEYKNLLA